MLSYTYLEHTHWSCWSSEQYHSPIIIISIVGVMLLLINVTVIQRPMETEKHSFLTLLFIYYILFIYILKLIAIYIYYEDTLPHIFINNISHLVLFSLHLYHYKIYTHYEEYSKTYEMKTPLSFTFIVVTLFERIYLIHMLTKLYTYI